MYSFFGSQTHNRALQLLRALTLHLRNRQPPLCRETWQIYVDIMSIRQDLNDDTTAFIVQKRYLFNTMQSAPCESQQVAIVISLLCPPIRDCITRLSPEIDSYTQLIALVHQADHDITLAISSQRNRRLQAEGPLLMATQLRQTAAQVPSSYQYAHNIRQRYMPIMEFGIFGEHHFAILDSSSRVSVPSERLADALITYGSLYRKRTMKIYTANNTYCWSSCLITDCCIVVNGRRYKITFTIIPDIRYYATTIGADFMEEAGLLIDFAEQCWYFDEHSMERCNFMHHRFIGGGMEYLRASRVRQREDWMPRAHGHTRVRTRARRHLPRSKWAGPYKGNGRDGDDEGNHTSADKGKNFMVARRHFKIMSKYGKNVGQTRKKLDRKVTELEKLEMVMHLGNEIDKQNVFFDGQELEDENCCQILIPPERDKNYLEWPDGNGQTIWVGWLDETHGRVDGEQSQARDHEDNFEMPVEDDEQQQQDAFATRAENREFEARTAWIQVAESIAGTGRSGGVENYEWSAAARAANHPPWNARANVTVRSCAQSVYDGTYDEPAHGQKDEWAELFELNERPATSAYHPYANANTTTTTATIIITTTTSASASGSGSGSASATASATTQNGNVANTTDYDRIDIIDEDDITENLLHTNRRI